MKHQRLAIALTIIALFAATTSPAFAKSRHERKAEEAAASGQAQAINGGQTFNVAADMNTAFETVVNRLKLDGYNIDPQATNKDAGVIFTVMTIKGGWHQTGNRVMASLIKVDQKNTAVRIAVTEQKRYKAMQTEPWSSAKLDDKATAAVSTQLQSELTTLTASSDTPKQ